MTVFKQILIILLVASAYCMVSCACYGQGAVKDTTAVQDTVVKPYVFQPVPKKAGMYSAILPGLGQLYNRQYWKIPVIYGGIAIAGYFFINDLDNYESYRLAYIGRINNPYPTDKYVNIYTTAQLQQLQNDYNKYLDLTVLCSAIGYSLQIMDAIVAAHLKNFDMSRDISMHLQPTALPGGIGMGIAFNVKLGVRN